MQSKIYRDSPAATDDGKALSEIIEVNKHIFFNKQDPNQIRKLIQLLHRFIPKQFYSIISNFYGGLKKTEVMIRFRTKFQDDKIIHPPSIPEYLQELYSQDELLVFPLIMQPNHIIPYDTEEIEMARKDLAKGKAMGVDELPDSYFKDDHIWPRIVQRILEIFNLWSDDCLKY